MAPVQLFDVFVGTELGYLKGINTTQKFFRNLNDVGCEAKQREILTMIWKDSTETEIICCLKNRLVSTYNVETLVSSDAFKVEGGDGPIRGIAKYDDRYVTCVESGFVKVWKANDDQDDLEFSVGNNVWKMRQNPQCPSIIGTGGKENDLKLWDLNATKFPIFRAKNVPRDFLDIPVPIWVTDLQFLPDSKKVVLCTGHHHIRLYDPNTPQKRPVISMEFDEYPLTAISLTNRENSVIVGNSHGRMALFDLRRKLLVHSFKGFAGSIRSIQCHPTEPLVASCGLDRFLRVHNVDNHQLIHKVYLKSRLNCLLINSKSKSSDLSTDIDAPPSKLNESNEVVDDQVFEPDQDDIWNDIIQVSDEENNNDTILKNETSARKRKSLKSVSDKNEINDNERLSTSIKKRGKKKRKLKAVAVN